MLWSLRNTCAVLGLCLLLPLAANAADASDAALPDPSVPSVGSISLLEANAALPECARTCLMSAIGQSTCQLADVACICASHTVNYMSEGCIRSECTVKESLIAKNTTSHLCGLPVTMDNSLIPIYSVFIGLAVIAVALRIVARVITCAYFWWDDFTNMFGFIFSAIFTAINIISIHLGQGKDIWFVPFDNVSMVVKIFFVEMLLYTVTRFFVRASIILFYLRVFPPRSDNKLGRVLQYTMVFNVIYNISFLFAVLFQCQPVGYFWVQWEGEGGGHCGNANILAWVAAATGIVYDLWLLALPCSQLWVLNLHWKKKIMGGMMFFVGVAVMIISLVRLKTINEFTHAVNPTKDIVQVSLWSAIELDVGVICPCLPSFRLLLRRALPRFIGTSGMRYEMDGVTGATGGNTANLTQNAGGMRSTLRSQARRSFGPGGEEGGRREAEGLGGKIRVQNEVVITTTVREDGDEERGGGGRHRHNGSADGGESADGRSCASVTGLVSDSEESLELGKRGGSGRGRKGRR